MENEKKLLEVLSEMNEIVNEDTIKNATTEQLLEYLTLTNDLKMKIINAIEGNKEE